MLKPWKFQLELVAKEKELANIQNELEEVKRKEVVVPSQDTEAITEQERSPF